MIMSPFDIFYQTTTDGFISEHQGTLSTALWSPIGSDWLAPKYRCIECCWCNTGKVQVKYTEQCTTFSDSVISCLIFTFNGLIYG